MHDCILFKSTYILHSLRTITASDVATCNNVHSHHRGRFSVVSQCKQKVTNAAFACKKYHTANLIQDWSPQCSDSEEAQKVVRKRVEQELDILKGLQHSCFPAALEGFTSPSAFILVTEL